jgi:membrane protein
MTAARGGSAQRMLRGADDAQRRHTVLAFPFAVLKKFGDDRASHLAALIAYYGFFSIFPLLLVFATVTSFVLSENPELRDRLLDSVVDRFPVVGPDIRATIDQSVRQLSSSTFALAVGIIGALWAGTAIVAAAQNAMDEVWDVPRVERPGLLRRVMRAFLLLLVFAASIVLSTLLTGTGGGTGWNAVLLDSLAWAGTLLISVAMFSFAFRVLTVARVSWRDVLPGAIFLAVAWTILLMLGSWIVERQISRASLIYGFFAIVIGLLAWISLAAQLFLLAAEINVVRVRRLWPRSLIGAPPSEKDKEVLSSQAQEVRARPEERVDVRFDEPADEGRGR